MSKLSKQRWSLEESVAGGGLWYVVDENGMPIWDDSGYCDDLEQAQLMAASPELLAALELVESEYGYAGDADTCECGEFSDGVIDGKPCEHRIVRAAIAKARGGAQ